MIDSRVSVACWFAAFLLIASTAVAQSGGGEPLPLSPPGDHETVIKVVPSPAAAEAEQAKPAGSPSGRFDVQELKAPDVEAVGLLDDRQGGFGAGMWGGTAAATVRHFLPQLPAASGSRTLRALARRLLLTAAVPPEGGAGEAPSLLELRAERLYAMGEIDGVASLLKVAPSSLTSPGLSRLKIDSFLLAGDAKAACAEAATLPGGVDPRMQVFCNLIGGRVLEANLALDLMRDRKDADHAFIAAAEALAGTPPAKVDKLPSPLPLHLAAFKAAKLALPADAAANATQPALLRAIADNAAIAVDTRLVAAERAEALGALETDALRKFYGAVTFSPAEQQAAMAQGDKSPRGRVLLLRAAPSEPSPVARAELIVRILTSSAERGAWNATARLYAPIIAEIRPAADLAAFAPPLARALYAAGRPEAAGNWLALAKSDPVTAKAAADAWPLARLGRLGNAEASPAEAFAAWRTARELPADQAERRAAVVLDLLQAVGDKVPAAEWLAMPSGPARPAAVSAGPALKAMLRAAAESLRVGETVLLALVALGETGLDKADADTLNRVVTFLRVVGLDREARELAVEAALANGA